MSLEHQKGPSPRSPSHIGEELDHDLRTPLAVIRVQTQLLLRCADQVGQPGRDRERFRAGLRRIDDAVSTMLTTIERINHGDGREQVGRVERTP